MLCATVFNFLRPRGLEPARLLCPWDFPGKISGAGCRVLLPSSPGTEPLCLSCIARWLVPPGTPLTGRCVQTLITFLCLMLFRFAAHLKSRSPFLLYHPSVDSTASSWPLHDHYVTSTFGLTSDVEGNRKTSCFHHFLGLGHRQSLCGIGSHFSSESDAPFTVTKTMFWKCRVSYLSKSIFP